MKAIWSGSISFGLVNIPIKLYSAILPHTPGFTLLCSKCLTPIAYERWCRNCHKEVSWQDTVKGLKQADGSYFIINQENLKKLKPEKTDLISINQFVAKDEIHSIYLDSHYYVAPAKKNEKEYFLFQKALQDSQLIAIGTFVMHDKEHVSAIIPYKNGLLLNTLNYAYEIKNLEDIQELSKAPLLNKAELALAQTLIKQLTKKKFDLTKFKDSFKEHLEAAIKASKKTKHKTIVAKKKTKSEAVASKSLMNALRASLKKPSKQPVARAKARS